MAMIMVAVESVIATMAKDVATHIMVAFRVKPITTTRPMTMILTLINRGTVFFRIV